MMLLAVLSVAAFGLGELPPQRIAAGQCLTFLWTRTEPPLRIAMVDEKARTLRLARDGRVVDAARTAPGTYQLDALTIRLDLDLEQRPGLQDGNIVKNGTISLDQPGQDSVVMAVGGIRGCR